MTAIARSATLRSRLLNDTDGVTAAMISVCVLPLLLVAALVVDLAQPRADRRNNQGVADHAALAAAASLPTKKARGACTEAFAYIVENHPSGSALPAPDCAAMPLNCPTDSRSVTAQITGLTIRFEFPVEDASPLMASSGIRSSAQTVSGADGLRCERVGVSIIEDASAAFGTVTGEEITTEVHAVALNGLGSNGDRVINLLVLDPTGCSTLANNAGGVGGIIVSPISNPVSGKMDPGVITIDSNGADRDGAGCGSNNGAIDGDGGNSLIRADGAPFCHGELVAGTGQGCGRIESFALGGPSCALPACSTGGAVAPDLTRVRQRLTRQKVDHHYNCKVSYPTSYGIDGCYTTPSGNWVDQIHSQLGGAGTPSGFTRYPNSNCSIAPSEVVTLAVGNWYIACNTLNVNGTLIISGGNVVVNGNIRVAGTLRSNVNNFANEPASGSTLATKHSNQRSTLYMRNGNFSTSGSGSVTLQKTTVFLSTTSAIGFGGGNGPLVWTAPTAGPFRNLALWSESPIEVTFSGGAGLTLEGIVFTPLATIVYTGNGLSHQVQAQFVAYRITAGGNGFLGLAPDYSRAVLFEAIALPELIR